MFPRLFAASIFMLVALAGSVLPVACVCAAETNRLAFPRAIEYPFASLAMPRPADGESMPAYLGRVARQNNIALFCPETLSRMPPQRVWTATAKASPTLEEFMDTWARAAKTRASKNLVF